ncbi:MAG: SDR family oxidoreductase [Planctomycetota bacterium]|jgi:NAD(P)-dependent dehydrogenase (short-subunit alcohol dehydrogenase family)
MSTIHTTASPLAEKLSLAGTVALVSGGSGGIGAAAAALLADAGATVVSADVTPPDRVHEHAGEPTIEHIECDVSRPEDVRHLVDRVVREHERLDILVHCAGITRDSVLWKMDDEAWDKVLRVNLDSAFHLLKAATPALRKSPAAAVTMVSSINGERGRFGQANYAASKAGLIALARTAARELGAFGVRVNVVAPGLIETSMTADLPAEALERSVAETALGRAGKPEDVAAAVLFLSSAMAGHVTGQVLRVDGGQLMA